MRSVARALALLLAAGLADCDDHSAGELEPSPDESSHVSEPDDGFVRIQPAPDENPDEDVVEVSLVAEVSRVEVIEGAPTEHRTYNGSIPGPLIRAKRGDTLVVHLKNDLPDGTTIHWHGMRVPNGMDGVPGVTQPVVEPGDSFRYEFELLNAGVFWYHPHFQTLTQVGDGLYGAVLVEDPDEEPDLGQETVMAISDIDLFEDGSPQEHPDTDETRIAGREGATLLLNGQPDQRMEIVSGQRLRWRMLNMSRSRYLELSLEDHDFLRIGSDGGRMEYPVREETVRLIPGERVDLIVEPTGEVGTHLDLVTLPVDRGPDTSTATGPEVLLRLEFVEGPEQKPAALPELTREIDPFPFDDAEEVEVGLTMSTRDGQLVMGINEIPWTESEPLHATLGVPQIWNVINRTAYSHPFHMHGFYFQVLTEDGTFESPRRYKDTIDIPPRETLRLVPRFDEDRPGMWMFHCHILDHAESGMMGVLNLSDGSDRPSEDPDAGAPVDASTVDASTVDASTVDASTVDASTVDASTVDVGTGETGSGETSSMPIDETAEQLAAFLESEAYLEPPWVAETEEPRAPNSAVSPHGDVRVFANDILLASIAKGNGVAPADDGGLEASLDSVHDPGSMAVKEFYSDGERTGRAAFLKLEGSANQVVYYCDAPQDTCGTLEQPPVYGIGATTGCGTCHGGVIFTVNFPSP